MLVEVCRLLSQGKSLQWLLVPVELKEYFSWYLLFGSTINLNDIKPAFQFI